MKNVTITLNDEVARWAKIHAAKHDMSLSRMVGQMLKKEMLFEQNYHSAMQQYLSQPPMKIKKARAIYPKRESLHER